MFECKYHKYLYPINNGTPAGVPFCGFISFFGNPEAGFPTREEVIQEGQAGIVNCVPDASGRNGFHMSVEKQ